MPHRDWLTRLDHMLNAIDRICALSTGKGRHAFDTDYTIQDAICWNIHVLGEASKHIPEDVRQRYPDVRWQAIRSMRNVIVHRYEQLRLDILWHTIHEDLPPLREQLDEIRRRERDASP